MGEPDAGAGAPAEPPALVAAARAGDDDAFGALYRRFRPLVRGVLLARLPPADADDVTQEVFMVAHKKLGALRDDAAIGAWLCTIARTRAIDRLRAQKPAAPYDESVHAVAAPGASALEVLEARRVLAAIQELPEAYREPLVLRLVEGLSGPEIARLTGLTEGSVRVNLHRGMALLRERVA